MKSLTLELEHIRCFSKDVFTWSPVSGIHLLSGPSGAGKSSICMAIQFAITGKGTRIMQHGETSCKVTLTYETDHHTIRICRTRRPNRVVLMIGDGVWEDDAAQGEIDRIFGFDFSITSYIMQFQTHSFVAMSSVEKLQFLETIAFSSSTSPSSLKTKCKQEIHQLQERHASLMCMIQQTKQHLTTCPGWENKDSMLLKPSDSDLDVSSFDEREHQWIQQKKEWERARDQYRLEKEQFVHWSTKRALVDEWTCTRDAMQTPTETEWKEYYMFWDRYFQLQTKWNTLQTQYQSQCTALEKQRQMHQASLEKLRGVPIQEMEQKLQDLQQTIQSAIVSNTVVSCPSCHTSLRWKQGALEYVEHSCVTTENQLREWTQQCKTWKQTIESHFQSVHQLETNIQQPLPPKPSFPEWEQLRPTYSVPEESSFRTQYAFQLQQLQERKRLTKQIQSVQLAPTFVFSAISSESEDEEYKCRIEQCQDDLHHIQTRRHEVKMYLRAQEQQRYVRELETNITHMTMESGYIQEEIQAISTLMHTIMESEHECLDHLIRSLNASAQRFLRSFFEIPMVVECYLQTDTKLGTKKCQLGFRMEYKGMECDISALSGGEWSRVVLAFTLALAEWVQSPFILLDECTNSLDQECMMTILQNIRTFLPDTCILCVAHQSVEGIFDSITNVGTPKVDFCE